MNESAGLQFSTQAVMDGYRERRFDEVSERLLEVLRYFQMHTYAANGVSAQRLVDAFVNHFLFLFTQEDYVLSPQHIPQFIDLNAVIGNVVAMSSFRTTDAAVGMLNYMNANFAKMLALYSARNRLPIDRKVLFDTDASLAMRWYLSFWESYKSCCIGRESLQQMRQHLQFRDERIGAVSAAIPHAFFGCTYVDVAGDRALKNFINRTFQQWAPAQAPIDNRPDFRRIAVLSGFWFPSHSVYRCTHAFVKALARDFDLTLVHLGGERNDLDTSLFKDVRRFDMRDPNMLATLTPNDWGIAYYPDVGMNNESILLSNIRLAPIQICGYGHPVSTYGSRIDYWLGGRDIEFQEDYESNYSERLVLVPGSGVAPNRPIYTRQRGHAPGEAIVVNCSWYGQKINFPLLERLRGILDRSRRRVRFRFFTGPALGANAFIPAQREIHDLLGKDNAEVFFEMPYPEYMRVMEQGDFSLDSYPFGGYATAIDALFLGKPVVTWEGTKFFNRSAASLLRRIGLEELIVRDGEAYEGLTLRLIHDDAYLRDLVSRLERVDLDAKLFDHDEAGYVVKAFHYLVDNRDRLRQDADRRPILIDR